GERAVRHPAAHRRLVDRHRFGCGRTRGMSTPSSRCQVWWARPAVETPRLLGLLDDLERGRHAAYQRTVDQARFLAGRVVGKALLAQRLGVEPGEVVLDSTCPECGRPHGKPRVVRPEAYPPDRPLPEMS